MCGNNTSDIVIKHIHAHREKAVETLHGAVLRQDKFYSPGSIVHLADGG